MQTFLENPWVVNTGSALLCALILGILSQVSKSKFINFIVVFLCGLFMGGLIGYQLQHLNTPPIPCLGRVEIRGGDHDGLECVVAQTGDYYFRYTSGAYSVYKKQDNEKWRAQVAVFVNTSIPPLNDDFDINDFAALRVREMVKAGDAASAEAVALQIQEQDHLYLEEGNIIRILPIDYGTYRDNEGFVVYTIALEN